MGIKYLFFTAAFAALCYSAVSVRGDKPALQDPGGRAYCISPSGSDSGAGTTDRPWRTMQKLNGISFRPGDSILFEGGRTFAGTLRVDAGSSGNEGRPVLIGSYGKGHALIRSGRDAAILLSGTEHISVRNLDLAGAGRKNGNAADGLSIIHCQYITADSLDISGFQHSGLLVQSSSYIGLTNVRAHENGAAGIAVEGTNGTKESAYIRITHCLAENNPGDPSNLTNHSGNGIVAGHCRDVVIGYCTATNNGWDMPRIGNGPVGIWAYEADSVIIQHCLSYVNKTSKGAADGGGFDLDGGVTRSVVQYCLSYGNQGAGYCIFQYLYASPWHDNIFRYNISENDGNVSDAGAGLYIWNSSRDENQFYNCLCYNNTIYNAKGAAISYSELSRRKSFAFYNNIFIARDSLVKGDQGQDSFLGNDWWSLAGEKIGQGSLAAETTGSFGKEQGLRIDPGFKEAGNTSLHEASALGSFRQYRLPDHSPLRTGGADLQAWPGLETGIPDFNGGLAPAKGIGAAF